MQVSRRKLSKVNVFMVHFQFLAKSARSAKHNLAIVRRHIIIQYKHAPLPKTDVFAERTVCIGYLLYATSYEVSRSA